MSTDRRTVQLVVAFVGLVCLSGIALGGFLAAVGRSVPEFLIGTTSTALGALAALLAKTSTEDPPA